MPLLTLGRECRSQPNPPRRPLAASLRLAKNAPPEPKYQFSFAATLKTMVEACMRRAVRQAKLAGKPFCEDHPVMAGKDVLKVGHPAIGEPSAEIDQVESAVTNLPCPNVTTVAPCMWRLECRPPSSRANIAKQGGPVHLALNAVDNYSLRYLDRHFLKPTLLKDDIYDSVVRSYRLEPSRGDIVLLHAFEKSMPYIRYLLGVT